MMDLLQQHCKLPNPKLPQAQNASCKWKPTAKEPCCPQPSASHGWRGWCDHSPPPARSSSTHPILYLPDPHPWGWVINPCHTFSLPSPWEKLQEFLHCCAGGGVQDQKASGCSHIHSGFPTANTTFQSHSLIFKAQAAIAELP